MKLNRPQDYLITVAEDLSYHLHAGDARCKFSKPASTPKLAKLYTLSEADKLIYVGIASQSMSSRLSFGFRASGEGGYHGYKWKGLRNRLALTVWTAETKNGPAPLRALETVEAEVAFLCRHLSGQWPQFQHEIHFYPSTEEHREAAEVIYRHAIGRDGRGAG